MCILCLLLSDYIKDKPGGTGPALELRSALHWRLLFKNIFAVDRIDRQFFILAVIVAFPLVAAELVAWQSIFLSHRQSVALESLLDELSAFCSLRK